MSTIYERPDGSIVMYTKGADGVIYDRLDQAASSEVKVFKYRLHTGSLVFFLAGGGVAACIPPCLWSCQENGFLLVKFDAVMGWCVPRVGLRCFFSNVR
jgi:hypothetical protein